MPRVCLIPILSRFQQRLAQLWACPELLTRPRIEQSTRMTRSLGRCYPARDLIRFTASLDKLDERLTEEIITHELAHLVVHWRHGRAVRPHGREWRALMTAAGHPARAKLPADTGTLPIAMRTGRRYLHRCPVCGASRPAGRPVKEWRCVRCTAAGLDGRLHITKLGTPAEGGATTR